MPYAGRHGKEDSLRRGYCRLALDGADLLGTKRLRRRHSPGRLGSHGQTEGVELGLIILDLNLAGESGMMLMRFLKRNNPEVPVLLYTGLEHDDTTITEMLREGADRYLKKGSPEELLKTVQISFKGA